MSPPDRGRVVVFAPAPLLTITVEQRGGEPDVHLHAGGQGFWIARMIAALGVPVTVCGCFGGESGAVLVPLIEREGVAVRATTMGSANVVVVRDARDGDAAIVETPTRPLSRHDLDELYGAVLVEGLAAGVCVLAGRSPPPVLPADTYRRLASDLHANGRSVVADLAGDALDEVLAGGVDVLKVSDEELGQDGRVTGLDDDAALWAIGELRAAGAGAVVVSRADRPALAAWDGTVVEVTGPRIEPVDQRGAGDAMTAGIAAGLARGQDLPSALRLGAAAGGLNVARHGLATGHRQEIEEMVAHIELRPSGAARPEREQHEVATVDDLVERARPS